MKSSLHINNGSPKTIIISALTFVCQNNGGIIINIFDFLLNEASLNI